MTTPKATSSTNSPARPPLEVDWRVDPDWTRRPEYVEGYTFDPVAAERPCRFIEGLCRHPGEAGEAASRIRLLDWQRHELIHPLFGWRRPDGRLRYRRGAIFVPKKNRKSSAMSQIAQYLLTAHFPLADVYPAAVDREQARVIYRMVKRSVEASPHLRDVLQVVDSKSIIRNRKHGNELRCLSADSYRQEGLNGSVIVDEIHAHRSPDLVAALMYATRATPNGLVLAISTAGQDRDDGSIGWEWWQDCEMVMADPASNPTFYGRIWAARDGDDYSSPEVWRRANPSMGVAFPEDEFAADYKDACTQPNKMARWLRYSLNVWTSNETRFFTPEKWAGCNGKTGLLAGRKCVIGADLSKRIDLSAVVALFPNDDGTFDVDAMAFMPEGLISEREHEDRKPYRMWVDQGWIKATSGNVIDHAKIREYLLDYAKKHEVEGIFTDVTGAWQLALELQGEGLRVEEYPQTFRAMSSPTKRLEALVLEKKLRTNGNPALADAAASVMVEDNAYGDIRPVKRKSTGRIDLLVALVFALGGWERNQVTNSVPKTKPGIMVL